MTHAHPEHCSAQGAVPSEAKTSALAVELIALLAKERKRVATAESCTGGMIAGAITDVSGASAVFDMGIVSYANRIKEQYLGVQHTTLEAHGAVSEETAREMADGVRLAAGADLGIATTGIAGPGGGTEEKPVGLVYIGISTAESCEVFRCRFSGDRNAVRTAAVCFALEKGCDCLQGK